MTSYSIIGAGAIGTALAQQFSRKNIRVKIANTRGRESLSDLTATLGNNVEATSTQDALKADVVILAVPFDRVPDAVRQAAAWDNRIVVDATNAIKFPEFLPRNLGGRLSTEVIAEAVPGARVVKGFNTLPAAVLARVPDDHGASYSSPATTARPTPKSQFSPTHSDMRRSSSDPSTTANPRNSVAH